MRPIRLPEPPGVDGMETPEIFSGGGAAATVVRRAVLIGNGSPGAENQCLGLARALGLADNLTLYVSSPSVPSRLLLPDSQHPPFLFCAFSCSAVETCWQEWLLYSDCSCSRVGPLQNLVLFFVLILLLGLAWLAACHEAEGRDQRVAALSPHFPAQVCRPSAQAVLPQHEVRDSGSGEEALSCPECRFCRVVHCSGS